MAPLVRTLLGQGFRHADLMRVVEEAVLVAALEGGETTDAELCARTGLSAARLKRLRRSLDGGPPLPLSYATATRLISRWLLEPAFVENGVPRSLPLYGENSFDTLTAMMGVETGDALRELKRVRAVRVANGKITLHAGAYVPVAGVAEKLDILGRDGAEFLRVMLHNVSAPPGATMFQRKASYDNIGSAGRKALQAALRQDAAGAIESANATLAAADRDRNPDAPGGKRTRVSFGIYVCEEPVQASPRGHGRRPDEAGK